MKKRIIAIILSLCLCISLVAALTLSSSAESVTGKDLATLKKELNAFLNQAELLVMRDDYQNMPAGMQTKSDATVKLEELIAEADALLSTDSVEDAEAFLLKVFGGWDDVKKIYTEPDKAYIEFLNAIFLRTKAIDSEVARGEKGYLKLARRDYTIESWRALAEAAANIAAVSEGNNPPILTISRSEMWALLSAYYTAYDNLVPFEGDKEINDLRGYLYLNIMTKETVDIISMVKRAPFGWELPDLLASSEENPNSPETLAYKTWVEGAIAAYNNPNVTAEELRKYVDDRYYLKGKNTLDIDTNKVNYPVESPEELNDEDFRAKYGEDAWRSMNPLVIRDDEILKFRNSLFVGYKFRNAAKKIIDTVSYDNELGYYNASDYNKFIGVVNMYFEIANDYMISDAFLRSAYNEIVTARDELLTKKLDINLYDAVYNRVMDFYNKSIKDYRDLFNLETVERLEVAIAKFEAAKAAYEGYVNEGGTDADKLDRLYQDLISATYLLQQTRSEIRVNEYGDDPNQGGGSGSTGFANINLEGVYNAAKTLLTDMTEFNNYMEDALLDDGAYPYTNESLTLFREKLEALQALVDKYEEEADNEQPHTMVKSEFISLMLEALKVQIDMVNVRTSND